jgi:CRP-like cAMP-binding protein
MIYASWDVATTLSQPWAAPARESQICLYSPGEIIFQEGQLHPYFYMLRSGFIEATTVRPDGSRLLYEIYGPGTIFGEAGAFEETPRAITCTALGNCELARFEPGWFARQIRKDPVLLMSLICIMSAKERALVQRFANLASSFGPEYRLCSLLRRVVTVERRQRPGNKHHVHLTHEQLASMTGLSRVTVTRTLSKLADLGLVRTYPGFVELLEAIEPTLWGRGRPWFEMGVSGRMRDLLLSSPMSTFSSLEISQRHSRPWLERPELGKRIVMRAGEIIFEQVCAHPYFYLIRSGYVQVTIDRPSGEPLLLEVFGPGVIFGEGAAFDGSVQLMTCKVVADCALDCFNPATLGDIISTYPELSLALIKIMSAKQRVLTMKVAGLSSNPDVRVCDLLTRVAQSESTQRKEPSATQVHLTHKQIGAMTGLARVTVTRTLTRLAHKGLVRTSQGYVEILNLLELKVRAAA